MGVFVAVGVCVSVLVEVGVCVGVVVVVGVEVLVEVGIGVVEGVGEGKDNAFWQALRKAAPFPRRNILRKSLRFRLRWSFPVERFGFISRLLCLTTKYYY